MYNLEIDYDVADGLVVTVLKESYLNLLSDVEKLENKKYLNHFEIDELDYFRNYMGAMEIVLRYFMIQDEFDAFMEEVRKISDEDVIQNHMARQMYEMGN